MRKWNKLPALLLAGVMALGLTTAALAADVTYPDVAGTWSEEYVKRMTELELMEGRSAGAFAPNENMTRAELVLALYRLAGSPSVSGKNPFDDVAGDAAYRDAVIWANEKGIASGRSQGVFDPNGDVQRQEIAKILNAFAADAVGRKSLHNRIDVLSGYADTAQVSDWARESVNWAVASEFITGSGGRLNPRGAATRAQMAAILCRYMDDASTGDASKDNPRNGDSIGENELLVVSFGTSYNDNRAAIGAVESAMETAFPDYAVRRGFTSNIIIEHIQRRDGVVIDDVTEALARAKANGVKNLLVQPTHLMNGYEYGDLVKELEACAGDFETVKIGAPLLTTDEDFAAVAQAMVDAAAGYDDGKTAVCYMGHGSEAAANGIYARMQQHLTDSGHDNFFVGTVEAEPTAEDLVKLVKAGGYERVVLRPMMIVAGDHANNDMAGDGEDSWKSVFTAAGFQVTCEINGLGELEAIQQLLAAHAGEAKPLDETGIYVEPNPGNVKPAGTAAPADGVYTVEVTCKESMFKIAGCELTIADGKMTAALTLGSASFDRMFPGSAAAASAGGEGAVEAVTDGETATFTLPVSALDQELGFAAHSVRKDTWYDRSLTFHAESLQAK